MRTIINLILAGSIICLSCKKKSSKEDMLETDIESNRTKEISVLSASGTGDTYQLINKALGGLNGDVLETPDCIHGNFGPHIKQIFDEDLKKYVFAFYLHVSPDNDKCKDVEVIDRQRNEIKTYDQSPDSLKGTLEETVKYSWKFKLDRNFQPSPKFTHIHQIKPIDGDASLPIITLTAREKSGGRLEVIHTGGTGKNSDRGTFVQIPLSDFKGQWVEVSEKLTYSYKGQYEIKIIRVSDQKVLLDQKITNIDLWRDGTTACRPKWGMYRSLLEPSYLRDEEIRFNDFLIEEQK